MNVDDKIAPKALAKRMKNVLSSIIKSDQTAYMARRYIGESIHLISDILEYVDDRKNDLILIMTPEKQDKTLELSKHWSVDSTQARNEVIMKRTYPVKSVKCDKICSNY